MHRFGFFALTTAAIILTNIQGTARAATSDSVVVITKTSSSCTRPLHTVYVYTSDSSTYIVQDLGSVSLCSSTRALTALASDSTSASSPSANDRPSTFLISADAGSRSGSLWCAPTTITTPGSCPDVTPIWTGSISERTITSYVYGSNSSILRTITSQIPAITSYVYRSGSQQCGTGVYERTVTSYVAGSAGSIIASEIPAITSYVYRSGTQECGTSVYERTVTSYIAGPAGSKVSCPTEPTGSPSCPVPIGSEIQLSVRTITSQLPAMTSYVYRSVSGLTVTVTNEGIVDSGSPSPEPPSALSPRDLSSATFAGASSSRTVTSFVYTDANASCTPNSVLRDQTFTSYIYGVNTTITIQADGSACQPSFASSITSSFGVASDSTSSAPNLSPVGTSRYFAITTTAAGITETTTAESLFLTTTAAGITETTTAGSFVLTTNIGGLTETLTEGSIVLTTTAGFTETTTASNSIEFSGSATSPGLDSSSLVLQPTPSPVTANASSLQQQGVASDPYVVAQVVSPQDNPPITNAGDNDFLLVTFGTTPAQSSAAVPGRRGLDKRQASQPLVYNTTQYFSSVAGGIYNLSANAANAQNGNTPPNCALTICASNQCGTPQTLDASFKPYYYVYNSQDTTSSNIATFSIQCVGPAYVGLDNVAVTPIYLPPSAAPAGPSRYAHEAQRVMSRIS